MLQSSSRGTPVSTDITKLIRQHYRPPSAKPYEHERIQCRTDASCKLDKPEDYWNVNFHRRQNNLDRGFYSSILEPYRPIGGELILDPYELVTSSLPGSMEKKVQPRMTRRGTVYDFDKIVDAAQRQKREEDELNLLEQSYLNEDLEDTCPTAGFDNIKKFVNETRHRIIAVKAGMPYEEHVKLAEESSKEEEEQINRTDTDDMVIQSTSNNILPMMSPKFEVEDDDEDRMGSPRSWLTGSTLTSGSSSRRTSPSPFDKKRLLSGGRRRLSSIKPVIPNRVSLARVSSGITSTFLKRERLCRDQLDFLKSIFNILTALHNMKVRDLRTKVPLSKDVVERLQKEGRDGSQHEGGDRSGRATQISRKPTRRGQQPSSLDFDLGSERAESPSLFKPSVLISAVKKSRFSKKMMSTDTVDMVEPETDRPGRMSVFGTVKRLTAVDNISKSLFGRRRSRNISETVQPGRPTLETWEDFLNVQPQDFREDPAQGQSFGLQVGIVTKFMRWYRRASVTPTHAGANVLPSIDKDQLKHLEDIKEKGEKEKGDKEKGEREKERESYGQQPSSAAAGQEKAKRLPIWQQVAQEKSAVFLNKKKSSAPNPYTLIQRFHQDVNKMKRSLQKENTAELEKLAREKVASFRLKYGALSHEECSPLFEEQKYKIQQVKENFNKSLLDNFDIQPSKWYDELREKSQNLLLPVDKRVSDMIIKLQTFAHMDNKTVPYAKAKLCLLMMSLPAYDICQIQTQRALKFIFEQILLGQEAQFDEWLNHRKIPYVVQQDRISSSQPRTPQTRSPSPTFKRM